MAAGVKYMKMTEEGTEMQDKSRSKEAVASYSGDKQKQSDALDASLDMESSEVEKKAVMHLLADFVDLVIFFAWAAFYYPHIDENDQLSFFIICAVLGAFGAILLLKGGIEAAMATMQIQFDQHHVFRLAQGVYALVVGVAAWYSFDRLDRLLRMLLVLSWFDGGLSDEDRESEDVWKKLPETTAKFSCLYVLGVLAMLSVAGAVFSQLLFAMQVFKVKAKIQSEKAWTPLDTSVALDAPLRPDSPDTADPVRDDRAQGEENIETKLSGAMDICLPLAKSSIAFYLAKAVVAWMVYLPWVSNMPFAQHTSAEDSEAEFVKSFDLQTEVHIPHIPHPLKMFLCWGFPAVAVNMLLASLIDYDLQGRNWPGGSFEYRYSSWQHTVSKRGSQIPLSLFSAFLLWQYRELAWKPVIYAGLIIHFSDVVVSVVALHFLVSRLPARSKERATDLDKAVAKHVYYEILYDFVQLGVQAWILEQVQFKEGHEHFFGKLLIDFANLLSTALDLVLLKGPEALLEADGIEGLIELARNATKSALMKSREAQAESLKDVYALSEEPEQKSKEPTEAA
eukprot:TRINITY_DN44738_c0_g1_i1.p1 TRINITY_DN44738_c0_g1~~TRINITY_DN44738_c0_g1_i1.p1  ORF type:complete len:566 (-),score=85.05 TRINITY_DN44738_c0_g1_i1:263-1960(-)